MIEEAKIEIPDQEKIKDISARVEATLNDPEILKAAATGSSEPKVVLPIGLILQFQLGLQYAAEKGPFQFNVTSTNVKGKQQKLRILILEDLPNIPTETNQKPQEVIQ